MLAKRTWSQERQKAHLVSRAKRNGTDLILDVLSRSVLENRKWEGLPFDITLHQETISGYLPRYPSVGASKLFTDGSRSLWLPFIPVSLKNRTRQDPRSKRFYTDDLVKRDKDRIQKIRFTAEREPPFRERIVIESEWRIRVCIVRTAPKKKGLVRNLRRGDPCSAHELIMDALEGWWYKNDECVTYTIIQEIGRAPVTGTLVLGHSIPAHEETWRQS